MIARMKKILGWRVLVGLLVVLVALPPIVRNAEWRTLSAATRAGTTGAYVQLGEGLAHYEMAGPDTAPPVLLVHGFSVPSYIFDPTFAALVAAGHRVIRFDLYGRGTSDRPGGDYDIARFTRQVDELLTALDVQGPVDLVGLSMGGPIVAGYTVEHPERVRRLVLLDPMASTRDLGMLHWPLLGDYLFRVAVLPGMAAGQASDFAHPERFPDWANRYRDQMRYCGFGRAILSTLRHVVTRDPMPTYHLLGAQRRPVLLIWGELDQTTPYALSAQVREALGEHQFLSVPDAGHLPHLERPELVEPALLAFLAAP
jgi:pimeloyl-ACP methyl ester carboxylesterase